MPPPRQATLGYVKKQQTLGKFFTLPANTKPPKPEQTKLKRKKVDEGEEAGGGAPAVAVKEEVVKKEVENEDVAMDVDVAVNSVEKVEEKEMVAKGSSKNGKASRKRARSPSDSKPDAGSVKRTLIKEVEGSDKEQDKDVEMAEEGEDIAPKPKKKGKLTRDKEKEEKGTSPPVESLKNMAVVEKEKKGKESKETMKEKRTPVSEPGASEEDVAIQPKKRRGRPSKKGKESQEAVKEKETPVSEPEASEEDIAIQPKKRRGRPSKIKEEGPVKETEEEDTEKSEEAEDEKPKKKAASPRKKSPPKKNTATTSKPTKKNSAAVEATEEAAESENELSDSDSEIKPALSAAARKTVQEQLSSTKTKHAYPDWPAGTSTPYAAVCASFTLMEGTTKRLEKLQHLSLLLRQVLRLNPDELLLVVHILTNKLAADFEGIELGIGEASLMKAIAESCGRSVDKIRADHKETGDLGAVAQASRQNQGTLMFLKPKPLTVASVHDQLLQIATTKGEGTLARKIDVIKKLLASAGKQGAEAKYLIRALEGKMRLGTADQTVLVGLSQAVVAWEQEKLENKPTVAQLAEGEEIIRSVFSQCPSYEVIIPAIVKYGIGKLKENCKLQPGIPLKPMLAKPSKSIASAVDVFKDKTFTMEYKYDGERAQIHYVSPTSKEKFVATTLNPLKKDYEQKGLTRIFSRNSEDLSVKYPDIMAVLNEWVKPEVESFVLDCEAVAWDEKEQKLLPFQTLMTRKRKDVAIEDVQVKVAVFAFDLLFLNGKSLVKEDLSERRRLMYESFIPSPGKFGFATYMNADATQLDELQTFLDESIKGSCEGLMVKALTGPESVYEPSRRSSHWIKIKKDYLAGIGDSLDLVVIGAYHGKGKRTSVFGAFLLACYNPSKQTYETICNIGTGFSEAVLEDLHKQLMEHIIDRPKPYYSTAFNLTSTSSEKGAPDIWFEPKMVWEVKTADLTISPKYRAAEGIVDTEKGISLRFPRFIRIREDKGPEMATSSRQVAEMYRKQDVVSGGGGGKKAVDDDFEY